MHATELGGPAASRCSGCGRAYPAAQWSSLALVRRLEASELGSFVRPWPRHVVVEARACTRCGRALSRLVGPTRDQLGGHEHDGLNGVLEAGGR